MGRLQDGERGIWLGLGSKAWEPGVPMSDVPKQEKTDASAQAESKFTLPLLFCCIWALSGLGDPSCSGEGDLYSVY